MGTDYQYIGWGQDDGIIVGKSGESIGFLGATPTTVAAITSVAITTPATSILSVMYGYTVDQANNIAECVRRMRACLIALGFMEASGS